MAVISLISTRGAPGVTTSALLLTQLWNRPALLAECDVATGSSVMAGHLAGGVVQDRGLLPLAVAHRSGGIREQLLSQTFEFAPEAPERFVLPGLKQAGQAVNLASFWAPLASEFTALDQAGVDVIVDGGRISAENAPWPVLQASDLTLLVTRSSLHSVAGWMTSIEHLRSRTPGLFDLDKVGVLVVGPGNPHGPKEIAKALSTPVIATLALDPVTAEVFSDGTKRHRQFDSSRLVASGHTAVRAIRDRLARTKDDQPALTSSRLADRWLRPGQEQAHA